MLNFTREERRVVLFLTAIALIGIGADFLIKRYYPLKTVAGLSQDIGKINLNTADQELLMEIPGIGEKLARRIIAYREKQAAFSSIEELRNIPGITDYRYQKIKDSLSAR